MPDSDDLGCASRGDTWEGDDAAPDLGEAVMGRVPSGKQLGFHTALSLWDSGVTPEQEVALMQRAGATAQRFSIPWRAVQPDGPGPLRSLGRADALYQELIGAGVQPVIGLVGAPVWAACKTLELECRDRVGREHRNVPPRWDYIWAYTSAIGALAARYPKAVIETWNEPNYLTYWDYGQFPDAARMARMQCAAYNAIKRSRPTQLVSSPGFLWVESYRSNDGRGAGLLEYLKQMYAHMGGVCWDVLGVHAYPGSRYNGPDSQLARLLRLLRNIRPERGDSTPVWVGEIGATTSGSGDGSHERFSESEQAEIVDTGLGELLAAPEVEAVFLHTLRDRSNERYAWGSPHYGFGLLREASGPAPPPKAAYCALTARAGTTYAGC